MSPTPACGKSKEISKLLEIEVKERMASFVKEEEIDYSEALYVDSQYEYLQKHKSEGITLEELRRRRASKR